MHCGKKENTTGQKDRLVLVLLGNKGVDNVYVRGGGIGGEIKGEKKRGGRVLLEEKIKGGVGPE